jgi:hypothetical protein
MQSGRITKSAKFRYKKSAYGQRRIKTGQNTEKKGQTESQRNNSAFLSDYRWWTKSAFRNEMRHQSQILGCESG